MAKRTKKVGPAGRYQARYGVHARSQVRNVEVIQKAKHVCPSCGYQKVKRISTSIWQCGKCRVKFAGGAYYPRTEAGQNVEKMLRGEIEAPTIPQKEERVEEKPEKTEPPEDVEKKGEKP
jgi:large subunit ribosomal protein L37Ae